jgi:CRP-like cAMP-binding protein
MHLPEVDFHTVPLFAALSDSELTQLQRLAHHRAFEAGETVFTEGEPGIGVFVVTSGTFELRHPSHEGESTLEATLQPGAVFGLTSLLDDEPRQVSAVALTAGSCSVLTRMTVRQVVVEHPSVAVGVIRSLAQSLRDVTALVEPT